MLLSVVFLIFGLPGSLGQSDQDKCDPWQYATFKAVVCLDTSDNLRSPRIFVPRTHRGEPRAKPSVCCILGTWA